MGTGRYGIFSRTGNPFKTLQFILYSNVIFAAFVDFYNISIFQLTTQLEEQRYKFHAIEHSFDIIL